MQSEIAVLLDSELVPPHTSSANRSIDRMQTDNRLNVSNPAIHKPRHYLVALRIKPAVRARLRHAVRQLPITHITIRSNRYSLRPDDLCIGGVLPINVKLPGEYRV